MTEATAAEAPGVGPTLVERVAVASLFGYVCATAIAWFSLPWNMQVADVLFPAVLACTVAARPTFRIVALDMLVIAYLVSALPSVVNAGDGQRAAAAFLKQVYLAVMYAAVGALAVRLVTAARLGRWLAALGGAVSAVSLLAAALFLLAGIQVARLGVVMPLPYLGDVYRLYGTFPSPEYLVNFLTMAAPLAFVEMTRSAPGLQKSVWATVLASMLAATVFTFGHGIAGVVLAMALCLSRVWRPSRPAAARWVVIAAVALVVAVNALLVIAIRGVEVTEPRNTNAERRPYPYAVDDGRAGVPSVRVEVTYNVMGYWLLKRLAVEAWQRNPLAGIGLGSFHGETRRAVSDGRLSADYREIDPHSTWFGRLAETGLLGTAALAFLWVGLLRHAGRAARAQGRRAGYATAFLAGLIGILANSVNVDVMNFRFLWMAFAVLRSLPDDL